MTGRISTRAKSDMTPQVSLTGERTARIPGDPASRSYYPNKGLVLFR